MMRRVSGLAFALAVLAAPLKAQLARPRTASADAPKIVVLPFDRDRQDSSLSLLIADGARDRLRLNHLDRFNPISRADLCRALTESGFPCDIPLEGPVVRQLTRWLNVRYVIEGNIIRKPHDSILVIGRLSETSGANPQSATQTVVGRLDDAGTRTGADLLNKLMDAFETFGPVNDCFRKLEQRDYPGALNKANDALHDFPNNAGAWLCIARVRQAQDLPADSVLNALKEASKRDTLNTSIMRLIAQKYQTSGDTVNLLVWLKKILAIDLRDNDLRINTIRMMAQMGQADSAIAMANQALKENPANAELLGAKAIAFAALAVSRRSAVDSMSAGAAKDSAQRGITGLWDSAGVTMQTVGDIDSAKVDSLFLTRVTTYFRFAADTANWIRWVQVATSKLPAQLDNWYTLSSVRMLRADTNGAIEALHGYIAHIPNGADVGEPVMRRHYALSRYMLGLLRFGREPDSAVANADSALRADSTLKASVAVIYLQTGNRSYRDSAYAVAVTRLQKAVDFSASNPRALVPASFLLGISMMRVGAVMDSTTQVSRSCDDVHALQAWWPRDEAALIAGAAYNRELVNQLLTTTIPAYKQRAEAFGHNFHCP